MKGRLLFILLLSFFLQAKTIVLAREYAAEDNPEYNLDIRTYDRLSSGTLGLIDYNHPGDPGGTPPQLCTLLEGNQFPAITNLYQIHEYDWNNNRPSGGYVSVSDILPEYASLVGFTTTPGQNILVPNSGRSIGQGYQAMILYASANQITLRYAVQDDIFSGYTIHLLGLNVDSGLLSQYQQANAAGRKNLPALKSEEIVGTASGGEILVSVRDSGSFMDPRWKNDWWYECLLTHGIPFSNGSIKTEPGVALQCSASIGNDLSSRPAACLMCNRGPTTSDCATTFTANDTVTFNKGDGAECGGNYYVRKEWGGPVSIDPNNVTIPFVGKKDLEDEAKYLADYFEGTDEYYRKYENGSAYWLDKVNYAGVNRKLTPMEYQNQLKGNVLNRAVQTANKTITANPIMDYKIKYQSRICWDFPFLTDLTLAVLKKIGLPLVSDMSKYTHYCIMTNNPGNIVKANYAQDLIIAYNLNPFIPFKIDYDRVYWDKEATLTEIVNHQPPKPTDPNFEKAWQDWANKDKDKYLSFEEKYGKWYYLWATTPLSTREDTIGRVRPDPTRNAEEQGKNFIERTSFMQTFSKVPHVARLYEQSLNVKKMFTSFTSSVLGEKTESLDSQVLAENTLLAQAPSTLASLNLSLNLPAASTPGNYQIDAIGTPYINPGCSSATLAHAWVTVSTNYGYGCEAGGGLMLNSGNNFRINDLGDCNTPSVYMNYGDTYSITVVVDRWDAMGCPGRDPYDDILTASCYMKLTTNGWESNCGTSAPPSGPVCGLKNPTASECNKPAITDPNPNDDLCCQAPIKARLEAVDKVNNPDYTPCIETLPDGTVQYNADCFDKVKASVSKQITVKLEQPYLKQIWDTTTNSVGGIFNLFRPASYPKFSPLEAKSKDKIKYEYINSEGNNSASPSEGDFYFPYLGGIQQAKEQTIRSLTPYSQ